MNTPHVERKPQNGHSIISEREETPREEREREAGSPGHRSNAGSNYGDYAPERPASGPFADPAQREAHADDDDEAEHADEAAPPAPDR